MDTTFHKKSFCDARFATTLALIAIFALAIFCRIQMLEALSIHGSYMGWATKYGYAPAETQRYLDYADAILQLNPHKLDQQGYLFFFYTEGYSLLLAIIKLFGVHNIETIRFIQLCFDSSAIFAIYLLARRLSLQRYSAFTAAFIYATYPIFSYNSVLIMAEAFSPAMVSWLLLLADTTFNKNKKWLWIIFGFIFACTFMVRMDLMLLAIPLLGIYFFCTKISWRSFIYNGCLFLTAIFIILASWGLINKISYNQWVFTASNTGVNLWEGLGIVNNSYGYEAQDTTVRALLNKNNLQYETVEANQFLIKQYLLAWKEHPHFVLSGIYQRAINTLQSDEYIRFNYFTNYIKVPLIYHWLHKYGPFVLAIAIVLLIRQRKNYTAAFIALPFLYALVICALTRFFARYIRYADISFLLASCVLLDYCLIRLQSLYHSKFILPSSSTP